MQAAPLPANETARLEVLRRYEVLDSAPEKEFDDLCLLASQICGTPIAMISLVDEARQWFKSKVGVTVSETARDIAFCSHAILQTDLFVVEDASKDTRFSTNPLVTSDPKIRFYVGAPLMTPDGFAVGTICVVDREPRHLAPEQAEALRALSRQVVTQLELRHNVSELGKSIAQRQRLEQNVRESERRLFQFLEAVPVGVFVVDSDGRPYYANQAARKILGRGIAPESAAQELSEVYKVYIAGTTQEYPADHLPIIRALAGKTVMIDDMEIHRVDKIVPVQVWAAPIYDEKGKILYAIAAFSDVTSHRWAERRLYAQYAASRVLAESETIDQAVPKILQAICESVQWEIGLFWNLDKEANVLRCVHVWHAPDSNAGDFEILSRKLSFPIGFGMPGRVWESGKPTWIPNVVADPNFPRMPAAIKSNLHAGLGFPILIGGEVVGVMEFFSKSIYEPDEELLTMVGALGTQMGLYIVRKRAEEKHDELVKELEKARETQEDTT